MCILNAIYLNLKFYQILDASTVNITYFSAMYVIVYNGIVYNRKNVNLLH